MTVIMVGKIRKRIKFRIIISRIIRIQTITTMATTRIMKMKMGMKSIANI